ncbi:hypothetical protein MRB53_011456 [Persea americana]|uniref:Uncharacterized protein n=1 Tax=Persea americana TaxID=3435 RepID=A0ACC2LV31_PERAE|nr:hypothetical protein MRB53_011456 [Persea americana]
MDEISLAFLWFGLASVITGVLSSGGGGFLPLEGSKIIPVSMSITLIALAASASLPLCLLYITICCRLSICSSALTCAFLLSPFLPGKLFRVPYIACVFTLLHLLQSLLSDPLQRSLQQIWCDTWKAVRGAACSAYDATVSSLKALLESYGAPETSTSPYSSSPAPAA